ncbi:hypothetical protein B0H10DRAFT_1960682 [Mycena sp. CBHHK59/15]|nr:hypothetical protein B0H10DRAFT_1963654 [Mycena sp. CBHHK59/15]KAJ6591943.1 hypothetical protein B0H10DRAFT_1960682 [Mycena sp. CBHHK59/15]
MVAHEWTNDEQREFLCGKLPAYMAAQEGAKKVSLTRFWNKLDQAWFERWPEEGKLGLPPLVPGGEPRTAAQTELLGAETAKSKERLKAWLRYRAKVNRRVPGAAAGPSRQTQRSLFRVLKKNEVKRAVRPVEVYQKIFGAKIKEEIMKRGYGELNEEAEAERERAAAAEAGLIEFRVLTEDETKVDEMQVDNETVARVRKTRGLRMSLWRNTVIEMYGAESEDVKGEVEAATVKFNAERAIGEGDANDDKERTPEEYQHGIDQIGGVFAKIQEATMLEAGWFGITLVGGPMPRRGGVISTKTICFGTTPLGSDFQANHPNFEEVKSQFNKFLKRAFPHEVRDSRGFPAPGTDEATDALRGLISLDPVDDDDDDDMGAAATTKSGPPKRIRRKKPSAAVSVHATPPVSGRASPAATADSVSDSNAPSPAPATPPLPRSIRPVSPPSPSPTISTPS